jgi:hypothetical protein
MTLSTGFSIITCQTLWQTLFTVFLSFFWVRALFTPTFRGYHSSSFSLHTCLTIFLVILTTLTLNFTFLAVVSTSVIISYQAPTLCSKSIFTDTRTTSVYIQTVQTRKRALQTLGNTIIIICVFAKTVRIIISCFTGAR